ncbi:cytochrome P450 [Nocardia sp. NPDC052566]|uniref:cytochrome P450 n=1 Tax=Nocardia sp. NPDC052566 TaxID=3364330 RepID=UPI0037CC9035
MVTIGMSASTRWDDHAEWRGSVQKAELPGGHQVWVIAGYDDVAAMLADPRLSLDKRHSGTGYTGFALPPALDRNLLNMDGDEHGRIRRLAAPAFSRRSADGLRAAVTRIAGVVFASLDEKTSGPVDLIEHLCAPMPALVIGEMLGVSGALLPRLRDAAMAMFTFDPTSKESAARLVTAVGWLTTTFTELVLAKRAEPGDDLISGWVRARDGEGALSEDELVSLAFLLMMAGLENTTYLCGNVIAELLLADGAEQAVSAWPIQRSELIERADPLPFAIRRFSTVDVVIGDTTIPKGDTVLLSIFGADSDPARAGRPSLMFGRGPHYCLGAQATDLIIDAVVPEFFTRYPKAQLAIPATDLEYRASWRSHGLTTLPVLLA